MACLTPPPGDQTRRMCHGSRNRPRLARLPLLAMKHAFVLTESMPGMHCGLPNVRDHDLSIYLKTQGDAMAIGGYEQNPEFWHGTAAAAGKNGEGGGDGAAPPFAFGLFDLDWDTFGQNLEGHMRRCPAIEHAGAQGPRVGPLRAPRAPPPGQAGVLG